MTIYNDEQLILIDKIRNDNLYKQNMRLLEKDKQNKNIRENQKQKHEIVQKVKNASNLEKIYQKISVI